MSERFSAKKSVTFDIECCNISLEVTKTRLAKDMYVLISTFATLAQFLSELSTNRVIEIREKGYDRLLCIGQIGTPIFHSRKEKLFQLPYFMGK